MTGWSMNKLLKYLKTVARLEAQKFEQNKLLNSLSYKMQTLGHAAFIREPQKPVSDVKHKIQSSFFIACFFAIAFAPFDFLIALFFDSFIVPWDPFVERFFISTTAVAIIWGIIEAIAVPLQIRDYHIEMEKYEQEYLNYQNAIAADAARVQNELAVQANLREQWETVKRDYDATEETLKQFYGVGVIYKNYRNWPAVTFFCEYLERQICTQLTGPDGAYMKFEEALRFWQIENKLDTIIGKLDFLAEKIDYLSDMTDESNQNLRRIEAKIDNSIYRMDRMEANDALRLYHEECTARNTEALRDMAFYDFVRQ